MAGADEFEGMLKPADSPTDILITAVSLYTHTSFSL
jgi:hypothetical protein